MKEIIKYKDNFGNIYTKENGFFTPDEIDRRVKMGDLFIIKKYYCVDCGELEVKGPLTQCESCRISLSI